MTDFVEEKQTSFFFRLLQEHSDHATKEKNTGTDGDKEFFWNMRKASQVRSFILRMVHGWFGNIFMGSFNKRFLHGHT